MPPIALPVDGYIDPIRAALARHRAAVLTAAPGAGKTTRVPPALIDAGRVLLLQPRRVAARAMARRIAEERGWTLGREVGWHIRFDRKAGPDTRLLVVTEGILTAYLQDDPLLSGFATLIVDEFHERSIHADLGLALARQAWLARADLRILVMSATLDPGPVSRFLGDCPLIEVPGTLHPLSISYAPGQAVAEALEELLPSSRGDVLCFLPGAGEIARAVGEAGAVAARHNTDVLPLHGSLDATAQDAALSPGARRRIIIATNIAETSLTVPGVAIVIDSGVQKVARYNGERGVDSLTLERITMDSADQRAGRAARLGPGVVRRLWDQRDRLRPQREPEIHRIDLAGPVLSIMAWGGNPNSFEWFERPSDDRIRTATALLERLGASQDGEITAVGRRLQRLPLHPRLGRLLLDGRGSFEAAAACAWLSEPSRFERGGQSVTCDLLPIVDAWQRMPAPLQQVAESLQRTAGGLLEGEHRTHIDDTLLRRALLAAYPDRVAKRRQAGAGRVALASGHGAVIGRESGVVDGEWLIAVDVAAKPVRLKPDATSATEAIVRVASLIEADWLTPTRREVVHRVDPSTGVVKAHATTWYDALVLDEQPVPVDPDAAASLLARAWLDRDSDAETERLRLRSAFAGLPFDLTALAVLAAARARSFKEMNLAHVMSGSDRQRLDRDAPESLTVPSGRAMRLHYAADGTVSVSVKLQELFGLADTPRLGPRRVPVTFNLLAPNGRPVQTTRDLKSFWSTTYREVRKELRGRYPRHPWPEDPWSAPPTHRATRKKLL